MDRSWAMSRAQSLENRHVMGHIRVLGQGLRALGPGAQPLAQDQVLGHVWEGPRACAGGIWPKTPLNTGIWVLGQGPRTHIPLFGPIFRPKPRVRGVNLAKGPPRMAPKWVKIPLFWGIWALAGGLQTPIWTHI
jgi:hypothetical protein